MFGIVSNIVYYGISFLILAIFVRIIISMIASYSGRDAERYAFYRFLARLTDPFLDPVRRIVRPVGVFDLSFLIASFLLITLRTLLMQSLPPGW